MRVIQLLSRIAAMGAIALAPVTSFAETPACPSNPGSPDSCAPIVGCLGSAGDYFTGRALGWSTGTVEGRARSGLLCTGQWTARNSFGLGQANIACADGITGIAYFTYQDNVTGTAKGHGMLSDGRILRMWSGHEIDQFLKNESGDLDARLMCGDVPVPMS